MSYSYKQSVELFGKAKADTLFHIAWVSKEDPKPWRKAKPKIVKPYIKLSEYEHWKLLHKYLVQEWIKHTHIWNEAGQSWSRNIVIMMAKKKASGVSKWYPDYIVYPMIDWEYITVYIELKKARWVKWWLNWSTISEEQTDWIDFLSQTKWSYATICHWFDEAVEYLDSLQKI